MKRLNSEDNVVRNWNDVRLTNDYIVVMTPSIDLFFDEQQLVYTCKGHEIFSVLEEVFEIPYKDWLEIHSSPSALPDKRKEYVEWCMEQEGVDDWPYVKIYIV